VSEAFDLDLFVIGAGSGGVRAARMAAASYGARVAVAEERKLGGTCVNVGCIPKKLLVYAAHVSEAMTDAAGFGWTIPRGSFDWPTLIRNKDREIGRLNGVYRDLLAGAGAEILEGRARLEDAHTVSIGGRRLRARHVLVATGSWPTRPAIPGAELGISSNEAFFLPALPRRVLIVGGGYIAVEFAGIFHGLGAEVTQVYRGPLFLRGFDDDLRAGLALEMRRQGLDLRFDLNVARLERGPSGLRATLTDGKLLDVDQVLFATGRRPLTGDLGLAEAGVELAPNGAVKVDAFSRSSVPGIWAVGDATDRINLTPVALHEATCFVRTAFGGEPTRPDHQDVASCVFSSPPLGTVGLTEAQARARYGAVDVYKSSFRPLALALGTREERTLVKLVVEPKSDRVVGVHMLGRDAGEIVQGFAVALKCGATKAQFNATIGIHPTSAEELVTLREKSAG
jgi:glutathione reductase (NADPH)